MADFVSPGQPFDVPARVWNDLIRTRDIVAGNQVIFGVPPARQFPGGGGSSGGKIWFNVLEISKYYWEVPGCEYVRAVVTQVSCDASVSVGDIVYVFDPHFCWFNLPIALMMRISGTATLSKRGYFNLNACGITPPECFWAVDSVCCLEEEYGS